MKNLRQGLVLVGVILLAAITIPLVRPVDPTFQPDVLGLRTLPPSLAHPLGTDLFSRDVLSRVLHGTRVSLLIAGLSVVLSVTVGTAVGLLAGFAGGGVDVVLMRLVDGALAIPRVFLLLAVGALWEHVGIAPLVLMLGFTSWFGTSRLVRAEVLSARVRTYVTAARALGLQPIRVVLRHILPNVAAPILVTATLAVGDMILIESGLSYLGFGIQPPAASLGNMISEGRELMTVAPWISLFPGLVIVSTVLAFGMIGEGLRKTLDPRAA